METKGKDTGKLLKMLDFRYSFFNRFSTFDKCSTCKYTCCSSPLSVDLTFADILSLSLITGLSCRELFDRYLQIGVNLDPIIAKSANLSGRQVKLSIELKTGCPFHQHNLCSVYGAQIDDYRIGRPLICATFPENLSLQNTYKLKKNIHAVFAETANYFNACFPCINDNEMSKDRANIVLSLTNLFNQEVAATESLAFGESPFFLDVSDAKLPKESVCYFDFEKQLDDNRLEIIPVATAAIRKHIYTTQANLINKLDTFLKSLDDHQLNYSELLGKMFDNPSLLPLPCKETELIKLL